MFWIYSPMYIFSYLHTLLLLPLSEEMRLFNSVVTRVQYNGADSCLLFILPFHLPDPISSITELWLFHIEGITIGGSLN